MRTILSIGFALFLLGCSDERTKVAEDYLVREHRDEDGTKILVRRVDPIDNITARDSLAMLEVEYERTRMAFIRSYNDLMLASQSLKKNIADKNKVQAEISGQTINTDLRDSAVQRLAWIDDIEKRAVAGNSAAMKYKQNQLLELRRIATRIKRYEENPGITLARTARVTYGVKRKNEDTFVVVTKVFAFSPDGKKVLKI